jgi:RNA polymerase sigma-70 factor (ECF subfamily)
MSGNEQPDLYSRPDDDSRCAHGQWFATTHWSVVLAARDPQSPAAEEALEKVCRIYWPPIYNFIRRRGFGPHDAQDLTQEFFARLLEKSYLDAADAAKGKFRTLLLTAVSRFLVNERERAQAQKRGGGAIHFSIEAELEENRYQIEPVTTTTPESVFERRWAEAMLETVLHRLRQEMEAANEPGRFEILKPFLASEKQVPSGAEIAARLGVSESAAYSAVHRLRQRYRELLLAEVAQTVGSPNEVQEELRYLIKVLSA